MKIVIISYVGSITLEHYQEFQKAHQDIFVDEGNINTVQRSDSSENLKN